jgi:hypothetical protein
MPTPRPSTVSTVRDGRPSILRRMKVRKLMELLLFSFAQ